MNYYLSKIMTYHEVHRMFRAGNSIRKISSNLGLNWRTVKKLLDQDDRSYQEELERPSPKKKILQPYRDFVKSKLELYNDTSAAQMYDWLKEHYPDFPKVNTKTVFNFVQSIHNEFNIPKSVSGRDFQMVEELPYGQQAQMDFGFYNMTTTQNKVKKVQFFTFILSHSRYKFVLFSDVPFTTAMVVRAHEQAFKFIAGCPEEMVYDQDRLLMVSENLGDIVLTSEFSNYVRQRGIKLHFGRKSDPQSKGKVENVVKYVTQNFLYNRPFRDIETLNDECISWLYRTANNLSHGTYKLVPLEEYQIEKSHLDPWIEIIPEIFATRLYAVHKDNKVSYRGNFYSVPTGTYNAKITKVNLMEQNGKLIVSALSGDEICRHDICKLKGKKIIQRSHGRDMEPKIEQLIDAVCQMFEDQIKAREWIMMIKVHKKRYIRDQLQMLGQIIGENIGMDISKALDYVHANNILSATDFRAYLVYLKSERSEETRLEAKIIKLNPLSGNRNTQLEIEPQKSDLGNYEALFSQQ
ncbi:IS21 family transposase [Sphingobacterium sp. ML3W]|uniref:IS21 family transposase n=1 Tax=Sphingobacterium sp. ML3W TaxID=1538644 RepID=UPI00068C6A75|nr:IS21 family transposase [Sphingobacterium sp. ML3W]